MAAEAWEGSNVDLGAVHEIEEELRDRIGRLDDLMREAKEAGAVYMAYRRILIIGRAKAYADSSEKSSASREREAEQATSEEQADCEMAEIAYKLSLQSVAVGKHQLNAVQTRAGLLKGQLDLDGKTPGLLGRRRREFEASREIGQAHQVGLADYDRATDDEIDADADPRLLEPQF